MSEYFHLSGVSLEIGSIIMPGNWGRIIRAMGWGHNQAIRELALESARVSRFPNRPSRLDAAYVFLTQADMEAFRQKNQSFFFHVRYRVALCQPDAAMHIANVAHSVPSGAFRHDWTDLYWQEAPVQDSIMREMLTLSPLKVVGRLA